MARLSITLFGHLQVLLDGAPLTALRTARLQSLFAYLVLEAAHPQPRERLAALFWPDEPEAVARQNLRQALYQLRQMFDKPTDGALPFLHVTRDHVQINPAADFETDVAIFARHLQQGEPENAAALYTGDLLAGLHAENEAFDEWLLVRREALHVQALAALAQLTTAALHQNHFTQAADYARRQLTLEPWREPAHRQLMMALAAQSDRSAALTQYELCRQILATALNVEPDAETAALAEQIRGGDDKMTRWQDDKMTAPPHPVILSSPHPLTDWGEAPEPPQLHGRDGEIRELARWLVADHCRVVALLGMGGMGKTTLAAFVARQFVPHFEVVIWRSLLNAPPLAEVLSGWLRLLDGPHSAQDQGDFSRALTALFAQLQARRCLLILDNVESVLEGDGGSGHYRPGYEAYGQLFKRFGETGHQSALLLTSREAPPEVVRLARERPTVQMLALAGLSVAAGQAILRGQGMALRAGAAADLVARYSGNPLALMLVGETIQELFDGDAAAFLAQPLIFDDIRDVLDQQWQRLSVLERDILLWLAIEREPLTLAQLRANLQPPISMPALVEAVNALRRRSLLEKENAANQPPGRPAAHGFLLQNVVTEYVTARLVAQVCREIEEGVPHRLLHHALVKAQAKEYVRQSQRRLILQPVAEQIRATWGTVRLGQQLNVLLDHLHTVDASAAGYGAGNLLNLLLQLELEVADYDFTGLTLRQADLADTVLQGVNLRGCHFAGCRFTDKFATITALTFSADGQLLVAGTEVGNIRLWRVADGQPLGVWRAHTNYVFSVLVSPDGATLYSCSDDQLICAWDLSQVGDFPQAEAPLRYSVRGHQRGVWRLALSRDGRLLASAGGDGNVVLWEAATGSEIARFHAHGQGTRAVAIDPHRRILAAGGEEGLTVIWHIASGAVAARL
ncbi:MAG: BTAD domain-containing putative transcriptional regulator [Caldilineaceae bacterium]